MRIVAITDLAVGGSGYSTLAIQLLNGLVDRGHSVKAIGLMNQGEQHDFKFSILPARDIQRDIQAMLWNLDSMWQFDALIVILDIPMQREILKLCTNRRYKYIGIFPVEADPLCMDWAMVLMQMDKQFVISEFGVNECKALGITEAELYQVGLDTVSWRQAKPEEKTAIRKAMGIPDDDFVVLTVADNQERKNLQADMKAFAKFAQDTPKSKYILVTREHIPVGWNLRELAMRLGIADKVIIIERGLSFHDLWAIYAASDVFMNLAKAEGLCIPILEAMAVGLPIVATDCTGMSELVNKGASGFLVEPEYKHIDPFGLGHRYWANIELAAHFLTALSQSPKLQQHVAASGRSYVESRNPETPIDAVHTYLEDVNHGK